MRATEFLTEREVKPYDSVDLELNVAMKHLNEHCSEALAMLEYPIWRSMKNHREPLVYISPSTGERESQNTANFYTILMDNSPYFAKYPKRSKSLVGTTDLGRARNYAGTTYALFPYNGTKIGVCPDADIWDTRLDLDELGGSVYDFPDLNNCLRDDLWLPPNWNGILNNIKTPKFAERLYNITPKYNGVPMMTPENFLEKILTAMSPARTGFQLLSMKQLANRRGEKKTEVWFSGDCIAIEMNLWKQFVDAKNGVEPRKPSIPPKPWGAAEANAEWTAARGTPPKVMKSEPPGGF